MENDHENGTVKVLKGLQHVCRCRDEVDRSKEIAEMQSTTEIVEYIWNVQIWCLKLGAKQDPLRIVE